jgi:hypothetical protein
MPQHIRFTSSDEEDFVRDNVVAPPNRASPTTTIGNLVALSRQQGAEDAGH